MLSSLALLNNFLANFFYFLQHTNFSHFPPNRDFLLIEISSHPFGFFLSQSSSTQREESIIVVNAYDKSKRYSNNNKDSDAEVLGVTPQRMLRRSWGWPCVKDKIVDLNAFLINITVSTTKFFKISLLRHTLILICWLIWKFHIQFCARCNKRKHHFVLVF